MKEIKFRAWDNDCQRMIFENDIVFHDGTAYASKRDYKDCISIDMELMQFTGLFDKNNVEIYEGDLIILAISENEYSDPLEVSYSDISACFIMGKKYRFTAMNEVEVIGNIYEKIYKKCHSCIHLEENSYCVHKDVIDSDTPTYIHFTGCGLIQIKGKQSEK